MGEEDLQLTPRSAAKAETAGVANAAGGWDQQGYGDDSTAIVAAGDGAVAESKYGEDMTGTGGSNKGIEEFLKDSGLAQYQDGLINMGFDDMEALIAIEEEDLDELKPKMKRGHRRKLLAAIRVIKGEESDSDDEAGMEASMSDSESSSSSSSGSDSESEDADEDAGQEGEGKEEEGGDKEEALVLGGSMAIRATNGGKEAAAVSKAEVG